MSRFFWKDSFVAIALLRLLCLLIVQVGVRHDPQRFSIVHHLHHLQHPARIKKVFQYFIYSKRRAESIG